MDEECGNDVFTGGDKVWAKPPGSRCTSSWRQGEVTKVNSQHNIEIDVVPRHVYDVRKVFGVPNSSESHGNINDEELLAMPML